MISDIDSKREHNLYELILKTLKDPIKFGSFPYNTAFEAFYIMAYTNEIFGKDIDDFRLISQYQKPELLVCGMTSNQIISLLSKSERNSYKLPEQDDDDYYITGPSELISKIEEKGNSMVAIRVDCKTHSYVILSGENKEDWFLVQSNLAECLPTLKLEDWLTNTTYQKKINLYEHVVMLNKYADQTLTFSKLPSMDVLSVFNLFSGLNDKGISCEFEGKKFSFEKLKISVYAVDKNILDKNIEFLNRLK